MAKCVIQVVSRATIAPDNNLSDGPSQASQAEIRPAPPRGNGGPHCDGTSEARWEDAVKIVPETLRTYMGISAIAITAQAQSIDI